MADFYTDPSGMHWPAPVPDPMSGAPANPAPSPFTPLPVIDPAAQPNVQPAGPNVQQGASFRPQGQLPGGPVQAPDIVGAAGRQAAAGGPPGAPDLTPGAADRGPAMIAQTTTDSQTSTTGVDKAGAANIRQAGSEMNDAQRQAGQAAVDARKGDGQLEMRQASDAYGRGVNTYFEQALALQAQDDIIQNTSARLEETARFKPDRTSLFRGDNGVLFGISAAISAMAGGWLMGQGITKTNVYLDSVMRMIDDDARDQVESNSLVYQELTKRLGSAQAAQRELKARMLGAVNDTIDAQSRFQRGEQIMKGAGAAMATVEAEIAKNRLDVEKAVAKNETRTVQKRTQQVPNPAVTGGINVEDPKEYARVGKVSALANLGAEARSLSANGGLAGNVGLLDEAAGKVAGWFNAKGVPAQRVEQLRSRWELIQRADWASEPNGQETQQRLSSIGFPQNDAGIPLFIQAVNEALNSADPGGRYRMAARAMGNRPNTSESGSRTPIVRNK